MSLDVVFQTKDQNDWFFSLPIEQRKVMNRGQRCYYSREGLRYFYTHVLVDDNKPLPCSFCNKKFLKKDDCGDFVDPCLGILKNVDFACCGHNLQDGYLLLKWSKELVSFLRKAGFNGKCERRKNYLTGAKQIRIQCSTDLIIKISKYFK